MLTPSKILHDILNKGFIIIGNDEKKINNKTRLTKVIGELKTNNDSVMTELSEIYSTKINDLITIIFNNYNVFINENNNENNNENKKLIKEALSELKSLINLGINLNLDKIESVLKENNLINIEKIKEYIELVEEKINI